jgi:hypothetical protein
MKSKTRLIFAFDLLLILLLMTAPVLAADQTFVYLPFAEKNYSLTPPPSAVGRTVNAPYFNTANILDEKFTEMAIFWFGQVTSNLSTTDVRVAYNDTELVIYTTTYDRIISYNPTSTVGADLTQWDTAALAIQTDSGSNSQPGTNAYRFLVEVRQYEGANNPKYQATFRGNGSAWAAQAVPFTNLTGYMGSGPGDALEDKGWAATFHIPYTSLGVSKPADGTLWRMQLEIYNRNSQAGPPLGSQGWPETASANTPTTWGNLRFGLPQYTPPAVKNSQTVTVRRGLPGATVSDGAVGGGADCGGRAAPTGYYPTWGLLNYAGQGEFNIQNQGLIADWPCFSRYYINFSLPAAPNGKIVRSAKLYLSHMGGSLPSLAAPSWIQVLSVDQDWSESTLNWNNGPVARENIGGSWVPVYTPDWNDPQIWNKLPRREWDVSRAVLDAYNRGTPLRLAMYSADFGNPDLHDGKGGGMHSGKHFVSNDTGLDWNAANLPTLVIEYVDP